MRFHHLLAAAASLGLAAAQVTTECQPLNKTCPPDPALSTQHQFIFNSTPSSDLWENYGGLFDYDPVKGATFTISADGQSPTIRTKFYFFFGRTEMILKASPGQGVISSMMWLSDDLDEVDWEFRGSNTTTAYSNYFGKGVQDYDNSGAHPVSSTEDDYHNYTTVWTKDQLDWYIDGNHVRTLLPADANNTHYYPQTPMRLSLGIWAGGAPNEAVGIQEWAGGKTDYSKGPFNMYIKQASVEDYSSGKQYVYGDHSGTWQSIKVVEGNSTAIKNLKHGDKAESIGQKWADLPEGAQIGVYAGGAAFVALTMGTLIFYCIRKRRLATQHDKLEGQRAQADRLELERLKSEGIDPDSFIDQGREYTPTDMKKEGLVQTNAYEVPPSPMSVAPSTPFGGPGAAFAGAGGIVGGMGGMRSQTSRNVSPAPSSMYQDVRSRASPQPGGLRAPPPVSRTPYSQSHSSQQQSYGRDAPPPSSPYQDSSRTPRSPEHGGYGQPPSVGYSMRSASPVTRSQSPAMPPPQGALPPTPGSQMRSNTGSAGYGRRGSPGPQQGYFPRMESPGPMGPPSRSYTGGEPGYRGPPAGRDQWDQGRF